MRFVDRRDHRRTRPRPRISLYITGNSTKISAAFQANSNPVGRPCTSDSEVILLPSRLHYDFGDSLLAAVMGETKKIVIVSDGTGRTAKRLMDAVLAQYSEQQVNFFIEDVFQNVRARKKIEEIVGRISDDYLVISSLIERSLCRFLARKLRERGILHLDVLEPMVQTMSKFLGVHPDYRPGLLQIVDERYYSKVDAIGYTVEHDDGRGYRLNEAELVLVGLSRTCKTPIAMYLSCNHGLKVANIPVIPEVALKRSLQDTLGSISPKVIFGVAMTAEALARVREERARVLSSERMGERPLDSYHNVRAVQKEVRFCRELFEEMELPVIDVTRRAIEEISREILERLRGNSSTS